MANPFDQFDPDTKIPGGVQAQRDVDRKRIIEGELSATNDPVQKGLLQKELGGAAGGNPFDKFDAPAAKPATVPVVPPPPTETPRKVGGKLGVRPRLSSGPDAGERLMAGLDRAPYELGGRVTDALAGHIPDPLAGGAGYVANVAAQAAPMFLGGGAAGRIASPAFRSGAEKLMWSALKPSMQEIKTGKAAKAIETMLNEGISVTKGGVAKLKSKISELNDQIAEAISSSPAKVDKNAAAGELKGLLDRVEKQVNPQADTATVKQAWQQFLDHPLIAGEDRIPVQLAQEMKQGTYRSLGDKAYGELKGADIESQKTLARGLKEQIAKEVPEVGPLNAKESELLNALTPTEYRVLTNMKNNPGGLAWLTTNPKEFAAFMADRSPAFKSILARMLNAGKTVIPRTAGQLGGASVGMLQGQISPPP